MNAVKGRKRFFGAGILLLMALLVVVTIALADAPGSYTLLIDKNLALDSPEAAEKQIYSFKIEGEVTSQDQAINGTSIKDISLDYYAVDADGTVSDEKKSISAGKDKIVTVKGDGGVIVDFGNNCVNITVVELTDPGGLEADSDWKLSRTERESSMNVSGRVGEIVISKGDGRITVQRPEPNPNEPSTQTATAFKITGEGFDGHEGGTVYENTITVAPGGTGSLTGLDMGNYTVEELKAPEGFSVTVGKRVIDVDGGYQDEETETPYKATAHINTESGMLTIKAPELIAEQARTHYYKIEGPSSYKGPKEVEVPSGESYILSNLPKGDYTIYVSKTYAGVEGYTLKVPKLMSSTRNVTSSNLSAGSDRSYTNFSTSAVYIDNVSFGPLYNANGAKITSTASYTFNFGVRGSDGYIARLLYGTVDSGSGSYTFNITKPSNSGYTKIYPTDNRVYVSTTNVNAENAAKIGISWNEYIQSEVELTCAKPDTSYSFTVDDRGWVNITKAEDNSFGAFETFYNYTITDAKGNPVLDGYEVYEVDENGEPVIEEYGEPEPMPEGTYRVSKDVTLTLFEGETLRVSGLAEGSYKIKETVTPADPMPFTVTVESETDNVTSAGGSFAITTMGERPVTLSKPGDAASDGGRTYTFEISRDGSGETFANVKLSAGQSETLNLEAGSYTVRAIDDKDIDYRLSYSDGSSVKVNPTSQAEVKFTNYFTEDTKSYRFIHEYYLLDKDGNYTLDGVSAVETRNADEGTGTYYAKGITLEPHFNGNEYKHCGDAYGVATLWKKGEQSIPLTLEDGMTPDTSKVPYQLNHTGEGPHKIWQYTYTPIKEMDCVKATDDDDGTTQIIILRYYREEKPEVTGKYNVVHLYYYRGKDGDVFEGRSDISTIDVGQLTADNLYKNYTGDDVKQQPSPKNFYVNNQQYTYTYDSTVYGLKADGGGEDCYTLDTTMNHVRATEDGRQIIVLRYYRGNAGSYNVVHEYYYRTKAGEVGNTDSKEENDDEAFDDKDSVASPSSSRTRSRAADAEETDNTASSSSSGRRSAINDVRETDSVDEETDSMDDIDEEDDADEENETDEEDNTASSSSARRRSRAADEDETVDEGEGVEEADENVFGGTLAIQDGYSYTFEGMSSISTVNADLDSIHYASEVSPVRTHAVNGTTYTYKNLNNGYGQLSDEAYNCIIGKAEVTATEKGDQVIILRYYRDDTSTPTEDPEDPEDPPEEIENPPKEPSSTSPGGGGGGGGGKSNDPEPPNPTVTTTENPPEETTPVLEETPGYPTELPDPNDPNSPERIVIWENGVPRAYVKVWDPETESWVYLPEDEVPLARMDMPNTDLPKTGDTSRNSLWVVLLIGSIVGILWLIAIRRKERL